LARIEGLFLAHRCGHDAIIADAPIDKVLLRREGTAVAQSQIVLVRAALVAMAGHLDPQLRVGLENGKLLLQDFGVLSGTDIRPVEVKVDPTGQGIAHATAFRGTGRRFLTLARNPLLLTPLLFTPDAILPCLFGGDRVAAGLFSGERVGVRARWRRRWTTSTCGRGEDNSNSEGEWKGESHVFSSL
jgi:hypothetical protein